MLDPLRAAVILGVLISIPALADFAAGLRAYDSHDYATALKEWRPIAEQGDMAAQFNLGLLYYDGLGVPQDFQEARRWFQRSADQGYDKAQLNLGAMYGSGKGLRRPDYVQAYVWLSLCAAAGNEKCAAQRDLVARKLKGSKLSEAQRIAREWKPKKESDQH
ncbi:MAG TPA: tetratricopeptide repeat protein [Bryobacteraceae bacterium]|jgi:TPR repeat protein|nr:tetratricopeptide repeat protein [Bryobacteraceae bacterium]